MKRFTMTVALLLMVAMPMMAERVTPETARKVATTFLNNNGAKAAQLTDLSKEAGFPNLYIFNGNPGFVVMAADDCVQPILGYSLTGKFTAENMPTNVSGWLQGYNDEIQYAEENQARASSETAQLWKDLTEGKVGAAKATTVVAPLIQTKWNQNKYYNRLCPVASGGPDGHAYTGCVATAMAQIMKYWQYPLHGIGSHSYVWNGQTLSADFGATTYDWGNMTNYYEYYYSDPLGSATWLPTDFHTPERIAAIATLMYHCGVSVDMNYGGGGSGTATSYVADALKVYFNYSPAIEYKARSNNGTTYYTDAEWIAMVKAELDANRPLEYCGQDPNSNSGHAFVCDGYDNNDYLHFNWGWAGHYDGYFSINNLNTGANSSQAGAGNGNYTRDQAAIFGIQPVQCTASEPTNLTYTLSGLQGLTLNWNAANGAVSYNIYRNGNLVGTSTTTTYQEAAPFGASVYYVRSADNAGNLSLSSNTVSVFVGYQQPVVDDLEATLDGNSVSLSWTAPEWCYPETESAVLNYGQGNVYYSWTSVYYAHRHLAANLAQYAGKAVYKVSTYIQYPGTYSVYIYTKSTQSNKPDPNSLAFSNTGVTVTISNGWYEFDTDGPIILTGSDDLWVVFKQENTGQTYPTPSFNLSSHNINAFYSGSSPTNLYDAASNYNCAWFINTYLTDGSYTYNLYRDGSEIAHDLTQTTYNNASLNNNAANLFTVKTNYYGGETDDSNKAGFAKGNAPITSLSLGSNDQMTVTEGSILTVSGALSSTDADNLILENGAQLIHSSEGVQASVLKDIAPYTADSDGWNFIASPVMENFVPSSNNGFLNGDSEENVYDLYYYDEPSHLWKNYETQTFEIEHKKGYLYANGETGGTTLEFVGTLLPSNNAVTISDLSHEATELNGFNLVGNPFACEAIVDKDFYVISENTITMLASTDRTIAPCEGIFVKATNESNSVTFIKANSAKGTNSRNCFDLVIAQKQDKNGVSTGSTTIDRARVRFGEGIGLEKFSLDDQHSQISLWQNGQDLAVAYVNGSTEMPVNFKASKNGIYNFSIESESLNLDYLHLIDNMTGEDVDLLATPNYTFEAKCSDYPSRFRLMFTAEDENVETVDNETFGFIANGQFQLTKGEGLLSVIDLNGRVIKEENQTDHIDLDNLSTGIYVVRLITDESIRTQKIIIE